MHDEDGGSHEDQLFFDYDADAFSGWYRCHGALSIEPGRVTFTPRRWRNVLRVLNLIPRFEHSTDPVVVITAAVTPIGCWLVLLDAEALGTEAVAVRSYANPSSVLEALRKAEFQVEHYATNVSRPRMIRAESDLELFRRSHRDRVTVFERGTGASGHQDRYAAVREESPIDRWLGRPKP